MTTDAGALARLLDKQSIQEVVLRYCRGIDRMDRELVRNCYHPEATDSHGSFEGGVDAFLEWVWRLLARYDATMHFVGNMLVEFPSIGGADLARCESYGIAFHRKAGGEAKLNLTTGFRYVDRFERRDGEWRIARRVATTEWVRQNDAASDWPTPDGMLGGRRGRGDALYRGFAFLDGGAPDDDPS